MKREKVRAAVDKLGADFPHLNWNFRPEPSSGKMELISQWLGEEDEEVMLCVFKGKHIHERFHRQDFFFLNFAMRGNYRALSSRYDEETLVREGECYIGQPYSGYALRSSSKSDITISGILIRRKVFFNEYLAPLSSDPMLLKFFLDPAFNQYADEYIHLELAPDSPIWDLLDLMLVEYADKKEDTQKILKPMIFSLMMYLTREYSRQRQEGQTAGTEEKMIRYIENHLEDVSLGSLSARFGYHPNYISSMLHKKTGRSFSEILLRFRMHRAELLMKNTDLSLEKIADMIGYHNTSNFYKAFRTWSGESPRTWQKAQS